MTTHVGQVCNLRPIFNRLFHVPGNPTSRPKGRLQAGLPGPQSRNQNPRLEITRTSLLRPGRPIENRPQDAILPYISAMVVPCP
jgi:hypothetical protein